MLMSVTMQKVWTRLPLMPESSDIDNSQPVCHGAQMCCERFQRDPQNFEQHAKILRTFT